MNRSRLLSLASSLVMSASLFACADPMAEGGVAAAPEAQAARPAQAYGDDLLFIYVHGFYWGGYTEEDTYGADTTAGHTGYNMAKMARMLGMALSNEDPTNPYAFSTVDYYGSQPPAYFTAEDLAEMAALEEEYGGGVPSYAYIVARFARMRLEQTGATQLAFYGHSMGGAITRWIIEHDLLGLVSEGYLTRWMTVAGAIQGEMAENLVPNHIMTHWGTSSPMVPPEVHQLDPVWLDEAYGGDCGAVDNPLYAGIMMTHIRGTYSEIDGTSYYPLFRGQANDTALATKDMTFDSISTRSQWLDVSGQPIPPAVTEVSQIHTVNYDSWNSMANMAATLTGSRRVTITLQSISATSLPEAGGSAELVYDAVVKSPWFQVNQPAGAELEHLYWRDRMVEPLNVYAGSTFTVQRRIFDAPVMDAETALELVFTPTEVDCASWLGIREACGSDAVNASMGTVTSALPLKDGVYTVQGSTWQAQVAVKVRQMF